MIYILFIIGFVILIKGADFLVEGSSFIASRIGISELIIGLTVVSIGTSMPELIVNIIASFEGKSDMAIGSVMGSNIANLLLILGVTSLVSPLPVGRGTVLTEIPYSLAAILLIGFLANAEIFGGAADPTLALSRIDGAIILFLFAIFFAYIFVSASAEKSQVEDLDIDEKANPWIEVLKIVAGIGMLYLGGKWVIDGAVHIAKVFNMSDAFVSLTIIAIGTSLPEMVTSVRSAMKGSPDLAVGNVIGSNIFNALWILGISSSIREIPFNTNANFDLFIVIASTLLVLVLMIISRKTEIKRWHGLVLLTGYISYTIFIYIRDIG